MPNPWQVLQISEQATEQEIRQAYLRAVQANPPERAPKAFEQIRDAYEFLRDPRRRALSVLLTKPANIPLVEYFADPSGGRPYVGPAPWLQLLRES